VDIIKLTEQNQDLMAQVNIMKARLERSADRENRLKMDFQRRLDQKNEYIESLDMTVAELSNQLEHSRPNPDYRIPLKDDELEDGEIPARLTKQQSTRLYDADQEQGMGLEAQVEAALREQEKSQRAFMREAWLGLGKEWTERIKDQLGLKEEDKKTKKGKKKARRRTKMERTMSTIENVQLLFGGLQTEKDGRIGWDGFVDAVKNVWNLAWSDDDIKKCFDNLDKEQKGSVDPDYLQALAEVETKDREWDNIEETMRRALLRVLGSSVLDAKKNFCCDWLSWKKGKISKFAMYWAEISVDKAQLIVYRSNVDRKRVRVIDIKDSTVVTGVKGNPLRFTVKTSSGKEEKLKADTVADLATWVKLVRKSAGGELETMGDPNSISLTKLDEDDPDSKQAEVSAELSEK